MGNLGAEKAKNQGLGWQQGCGGGVVVKAPEEKWGKMGKAPEEKWGKMGENGVKWGKMGRKWGGNGGKGDQLHHPSFLIFPHFSPFPPHFPPFFLAMGTLWVRLWVQYPPPEPGTSEPCVCVAVSPEHQSLNVSCLCVAVCCVCQCLVLVRAAVCAAGSEDCSGKYSKCTPTVCIVLYCILQESVCGCPLFMPLFLFAPKGAQCRV